MIKRDHDSEDEYAIISIGGTGSDFFKARNMNVAFELRGLEDQPSFEQVGKIISKAVGMYQNELLMNSMCATTTMLIVCLAKFVWNKCFLSLIWIPMNQKVMC